MTAEAKARTNPLHDFKPKGALAGDEILEELRAVNGIVSAKTTCEEAEAYRAWLGDAAQEAANAAEEGGFRLSRATRERGRAAHVGQAGRGARTTQRLMPPGA